MSGELALKPGAKHGESREDGQRRRNREYKVKSRKFLEEIRKIEAKRIADARQVIEKALGGFDDRPL